MDHHLVIQRESGGFCRPEDEVENIRHVKAEEEYRARSADLVADEKDRQRRKSDRDHDGNVKN